MKCTVLILASFLSTQQPQQPPPRLEPTAEDRRIAEEEARRRLAFEAEERAEIQQKLDQLEEDMYSMHPTPATALELEAMKNGIFPQFVKDVAELNGAAAAIRSVSQQGDLKGIRKKAKALESNVDRILKYLLDDEDEPEEPEANYRSRPVQERIELLSSLVPSVHERLKSAYVSSRTGVINVVQTVKLIQDLQALRRLSHSLRR